MRRNIRLNIEYDGTRYQGWQKLGKSSGSNTIQEKLESVLEKMTGEPIQVIGSGRTDAGVHAYGQVANFHTDSELSCRDIQEYLIRYLPSDIGILSADEVSERFHSRLNAKEKTYQYRIAIPGTSHVFERKYLWHIPETLDIGRRNRQPPYASAPTTSSVSPPLKRQRNPPCGHCPLWRSKRIQRRSASPSQAMASCTTWSVF